MNILMYSPAFYPSVGGLEAVVAMLAEEMTRLGCNVKVATTTPTYDAKSSFPFDVIRSPSMTELLSLTRWSDVFFHHNVSLKGIWPLFLVRRPWVVAHHGWYTRSNGTLGWQDRLKRYAVRFATKNIAVSHAVAEHLPVSCAVIPNPYNEDLFRELPDADRCGDLVFLGRLVSDKGCDLLLDALALLRSDGLKPRLTIIGSGPEESHLSAQAKDAGLIDQLCFAGKRTGEELFVLLNQHKIMVVPSRWDEPFGIVALEGIACGCVVIASNGGGLPEAVGPCGALFPNGDARALADSIERMLSHPGDLAVYRSGAAVHLAGHQRSAVARTYHETIRQVLSLRGGEAGA